MEPEAHEGVHTQDFALTQTPPAFFDSVLGTSAFAEYAEYITEAQNLRLSARTMLRSLLEGRDTQTEHSLAREITSTMEHPRLGTPTTYALATSAIGRSGSGLPSDFTLNLLKRLHRFASGRKTGTIRYRDEVLTIAADTSDNLDVCRVMSRPNTEDELQACLTLWKNSKPLQEFVNTCVGDYRWLTEWFRNVLPLPEIISTVARGIDRQMVTGLPYDPSWRLKYLVPLTDKLTHATQGPTQKDTTSDASTGDHFGGGAKVEEDMKAYPQHLMSRLTLLACGSEDIPGTPDSLRMLVQELDAVFPHVLSTLDAPTKFILDTVLGLSSQEKIKDAFPEAKTYMFWSPSASCLYTMLAPAPNGAGDYKKIIDGLIDAGSKEDRMALTIKVLSARNGALGCNGTVVKVPGLPDMYDYEREQCNIPVAPVGFVLPFTTWIDYAQMADGVLATTSLALEGAAIIACEAFCNMIPTGIAISNRAWTGSALEDASVRTFMDKQAEKSVLVISFGSIFFPSAHIETVVDTLLQLKQPFVFVAGGAGGGKLSEDLAEKVKASENGLYHLGWFDQISLLSHPATGWLMCHAGWNSICEALVRGVPLITWPFLADQPINAALVSTGTPQLGFELLEVRQGIALKPAKRGVGITGTREAVVKEIQDVIAKAFQGAEGRQIRENVEMMRETLKQEHEGAAKECLLDFVKI